MAQRLISKRTLAVFAQYLSDKTMKILNTEIRSLNFLHTTTFIIGLLVLGTVLSPVTSYAELSDYSDCKWVALSQDEYDPCNPPGSQYSYSGEFAYPSITVQNGMYRVTVSMLATQWKSTCMNHPSASCPNGNEVVEGWAQWACQADLNSGYLVFNECCEHHWENYYNDISYMPLTQQVSKVEVCEKQVIPENNFEGTCPNN